MVRNVLIAWIIALKTPGKSFCKGLKIVIIYTIYSYTHNRAHNIVLSNTCLPRAALMLRYNGKPRHIAKHVCMSNELTTTKTHQNKKKPHIQHHNPTTRRPILVTYAMMPHMFIHIYYMRGVALLLLVWLVGRVAAGCRGEPTSNDNIYAR